MSETRNIDTTSSISESCSEISFWTHEDGLETALIIDVRPLDQVIDDLDRLIESGGSDPTHRYHFPSYELMHKVLAPNRMAIIQSMIGKGPLSIREVARRVGRDFKGVHSDVTALRAGGLLLKAADGKIVFPYESIRFDFELLSAA